MTPRERADALFEESGAFVYRKDVAEAIRAAEDALREEVAKFKADLADERDDVALKRAALAGVEAALERAVAERDAARVRAAKERARAEEAERRLKTAMEVEKEAWKQVHDEHARSAKMEKALGFIVGLISENRLLGPVDHACMAGEANRALANVARPS